MQDFTVTENHFYGIAGCNGSAIIKSTRKIEDIDLIASLVHRAVNGNQVESLGRQ